MGVWFYFRGAEKQPYYMHLCNSLKYNTVSGYYGEEIFMPFEYLNCTVSDNSSGNGWTMTNITPVYSDENNGLIGFNIKMTHSMEYGFTVQEKI